MAIIEIIAHYIRKNSPWPPKKLENGELSYSVISNTSDSSLAQESPEDIKAILVVLRRLEQGSGKWVEIDLSSVDLRGAKLDGTSLRGINFAGSNLTGANFVESKLHNADFSNAILINVHFDKADLQYASFIGANLTNAWFLGSNLKDVKFAEEIYSHSDSTLNQKYKRKAILKGARLVIAEGLTKEHLEQVIIDEQTFFPADLMK